MLSCVDADDLDVAAVVAEAGPNVLLEHAFDPAGAGHCDDGGGISMSEMSWIDRHVRGKVVWRAPG